MTDNSKKKDAHRSRRRQCTCPSSRSARGVRPTPPSDRIVRRLALASGAALTGVSTVLGLVPAGLSALLTSVGFTSGGVAAGSLAAVAQSAIYGAHTGGVFSVLQSAGATLVAPHVVVPVLAALGAVAGVGLIWWGLRRAWVECECVDCDCEEKCGCACRREPGWGDRAKSFLGGVASRVGSVAGTVSSGLRRLFRW